MKYDVLIKHSVDRYYTFEVEAENADDAIDMADDLAMNFEWKDLDAEESWTILDFEGEDDNEI